MSYPRGFGVQSTTSVVQPMFGVTLSSNVGVAQPPGQTSSVMIVASNTIFQTNDQVNILPGASSTTKPEYRVQIQVTNATTITGVLQWPHNTGDYVVLDYPCQNVMVQSVAAHTLTNSLFLACSTAATNTGGYAFWDLNVTNPYLGPSGFGNADNTSNYWVIAASATTQYFLASAVQS